MAEKDASEVEAEVLKTEGSLNLEGSVNTGGPENTGSGAGTLIGDNMGLTEDPFSERINLFQKPGRKSVNIDMLNHGDGAFKKLEDDDSSDDAFRAGSFVSGNFAGINPVKTPGFNADKKFSFVGPENKDTMQMMGATSSDNGQTTDNDDISSMHSDFL